MSAATPEHIMQVGLGFWASKTLLSAVELGVFSTLADAPADLPTLQRKLALHQRSARDFLDALVALKLLERENGVYSNTADTDLFLDRAKPSYIGGVLEMANARLYGFWGSLTEALRTGEVQNENKGGGEKNVFAAVYADPDRLRGFLTAMSGISAGAAHAIAAYYIGLETSMLAVPGFNPPLKALCVVPQGMEEGSEVLIEGRDLALVTGQPAEFRFFSSEVRSGDAPGEIIPDAERELLEISLLEVDLAAVEDIPVGQPVPVQINAVVTELGNLELWMKHTKSDRRWKVEFQVRTE